MFFSVTSLSIMVAVLLIIILPLSLAGTVTEIKSCTPIQTITYDLCEGIYEESTFMTFANTTEGLIRLDQVVVLQEAVAYNSTFSEHAPNCTDPRCNEICTSSRCRGDSTFCGLYTCSNISNPCYCTVISIREMSQACDYKGNCGLIIGDPEDILVNYRYVQGYEGINKDPACTHALNSRELIVTCEADTTVKLQKDQWSVIVQTTGKVIRIGLPSSILTISGTFFIFSIDETGSTLVDSFYYDSSTDQEVVTCPTSDCILCSSTIDNFKCQSNTMKFFIVAVLLILTVLFFSVFTWMLYILLISCNLVYKTIMTIMWLLKKSTVLTKSGYTKMKDMWVKVDEPHATKADSVEDAKMDSKSKIDVISVEDIEVAPKKPKSKLLKAVVVSGLMSRASSECVGGVTQFSVTTVCTKDLYNETCTYSNFQALVSVPYSHSTACISFKNADNSSVVSTINVTFVEQIQYCSLVQQYFTSNWNGNFESHRSCYTPSNWCGGRCDSMNPNDATCSGQCSNSLVTTKPGVTGCSRTCGCAGCNCFYCTSACLPYRWALNPIAPFYTVNLAPTCEYRTIISACVNDTCENSSRFRSGTSVNLKGFTITSVGNFPPPIATIGTKKICINGQDKYLCDAANLNSPARSIPGDIQAASLANLTTVTPTSFIFSRDIASVNVGQTSATATFSSPGVSISMLKLPILYNSRVWESDGTYLIANETQSSSFVFTISSPGSFTLVRKLDLVCPKITFVSLSGCYSCPIGAKALLSVKSDCLPGNALISVPNNIQLSIDTIPLTQATTNFTLAFMTNLTTVDFQLTATANGGTESVRIQGTLKSYSEVRSENDTSVTSSDAKSDWDIFSDFYKDKLFGNWWRIGLSSLAHLILTIVFIGIAFNVSKAVASRNSKEKKSA